MKVFINGRYIDSKDAAISVQDRGLNYGDGLFETIRSYNGTPFLLDKHLKRLLSGARVLSIPTKGLIGIDKKIIKLIEINGLAGTDASVKIILTRGAPASTSAGLAAARGARPTIIITTARIDKKAVRTQQTGGTSAITVEGSGCYRGLKTLNYLPNVMARMEAERRGAFEAIFIKGGIKGGTNGGYVLEGAATNVFVVKVKTIITPPEADVLPGITRAFVMKVARRAGFKVTEGPVTLNLLASSTEAFLTNSIIEVVPLVSVDSRRVADGKTGEITNTLQRLYHEAVRGS